MAGECLPPCLKPTWSVQHSVPGDDVVSVVVPGRVKVLCIVGIKGIRVGAVRTQQDAPITIIHDVIVLNQVLCCTTAQHDANAAHVMDVVVLQANQQQQLVAFSQCDLHGSMMCKAPAIRPQHGPDHGQARCCTQRSRTTMGASTLFCCH